jgi:short-subunit dehydrogenase
MAEYALITGASSGLGKEFAWIHAQNGHNLVLVARRESLLNDLASDIKTKYKVDILVLSFDLSRPNSPQEIFEKVTSAGINVNYLINNAGFGIGNSFLNSDLESNSNMVEVNIQALIKLTHLFGQSMIKNRTGRVLLVGSVASFMPGPYMATYFASKNFVLAFGQALQEEWKNTGVTITTLCPGPTETDFFEAAGMASSKISKLMPLPSAQKVANYGYKAMIKGKTTAIYGFANQLQAFFSRITPTFILLKAVAWITQKSS